MDVEEVFSFGWKEKEDEIEYFPLKLDRWWTGMKRGVVWKDLRKAKEEKFQIVPPIVRTPHTTGPPSII